MKKKVDKTLKKPIRTYLSTEELALFTKRMGEEGFTGIAAYLRRLVILDSQPTKE